MRLHDAVWVTSRGKACAEYPSAFSLSAASRPRSSTSSPTTTLAPSPPKACAIPNPMPRPAPVTIATRSFNNMPSLLSPLNPRHLENQHGCGATPGSKPIGRIHRHMHEVVHLQHPAQLAHFHQCLSGCDVQHHLLA